MKNITLFIVIMFITLVAMLLFIPNKPNYDDKSKIDYPFYYKDTFGNIGVSKKCVIVEHSGMVCEIAKGRIIQVVEFGGR